MGQARNRGIILENSAPHPHINTSSPNRFSPPEELWRPYDGEHRGYHHPLLRTLTVAFQQVTCIYACRLQVRISQMCLLKIQKPGRPGGSVS